MLFINLSCCTVVRLTLYDILHIYLSMVYSAVVITFASQSSILQYIRMLFFVPASFTFPLSIIHNYYVVSSKDIIIGLTMYGIQTTKCEQAKTLQNSKAIMSTADDDKSF